MKPDEKRNIINRLLALELQQKKQLEDISALKKYLTENPLLAKSWEDLKEISGYYIDSFSKIENYENRAANDENKNIFATEKLASAALAQAQLSQLLQAYKAGWDNQLLNYCIFPRRINEKWQPFFAHSYFPQFLSFRSIETAELFYETHFELIHIFWSQFE